MTVGLSTIAIFGDLHPIFIYLELILVMARDQSAIGVNLWNSLPDDLKTITSFSTFKAHLKFYLQTKSYSD